MMMSIPEFAASLLIAMFCAAALTLVIVFQADRESFDGVGIERIDKYTYTFPGGSSNRFEIIWKEGRGICR